MKLNKYFVIDFDSTFTKVEALDVLADISLKDHPDREKRKKQIVEITNQGMDGSISFRESLERRLNLLSPSKQHIEPLISVLKGKVSESFKRNRDFFNNYSDNIYIISNGFREFIEPIVTEFGIKEENILANEFRLIKYGVALILVFVGCKMLVERWVHISGVVSLIIVAVILFIFTLLSILERKKMHRRK